MWQLLWDSDSIGLAQGYEYEATSVDLIQQKLSVR